jgi:hypothetical protein
MAAGNFSVIEWLLIRPVWREISLYPFRFSVPRRKIFFSNLKPMGNTDLRGISVLDITNKFPSIPNPQHELHGNPYLNPTVAEPGVTRLFWFLLIGSIASHHEETGTGMLYHKRTRKFG